VKQNSTHHSVFTGGCPSCHRTNSVKALKATIYLKLLNNFAVVVNAPLSINTAERNLLPSHLSVCSEIVLWQNG